MRGVMQRSGARGDDAAVDAGRTADLVARPGIDPRSWCTMGLVQPETSTQKSVRFSDDQGNPLPYGVLVDVKLQPSGLVVPCRVAGQCAGSQEGEWHPFVGGDEVLVMIPDGDERNGGVIVGRLNQKFDVFPTTVAGQPATGNQIAFKRLIAPYALESGTAVILRVAPTGAALTLDQTGDTYLSDGNGNTLFLRSDLVSLQLADSNAAVQLDPNTNSVTLSAGSGNSTLTLDGSDSSASQFQSSGTLAVTTLGNPGQNHATTTEAVVNLLSAFLTAAAAAATAPPALVAFFASFSAPATLAAIIELAAVLPVDPVLGAAISAGLQIPKGQSGDPGLGSPGFMID
jgi:phage baseplate assembly protein gpV